MRGRSSSRIQSSVGIARVSERIGARSRDIVVGTNCTAGNTQAYPRDEHCQPAVGSAADPWRVAQDRHRNLADECGQVYGQETRTTVARKTFLRSYADGVAAMDLFVVPTISFRLLYGLLIVRPDWREIVWLGVTAHPTAEWIAIQMVTIRKCQLAVPVRAGKEGT
jgi:hypothetical protein